MKKVYVWICSIMLILTMNVIIYADSEGDVRGKYRFYEDESLSRSSILNSKAHMELRNGKSIEISFQNGNMDHMMVIVKELKLDNEEMKEWFDAQLQRFASDYSLYEIYVVDENNNRIQMNEEIEVNIGGEYRNNVVGLSSSGKINNIASEKKDNTIIFHTDLDSDYYVAYDDISKNQENREPNVSNISETKSPKTGDDFNSSFGFILLISSMIYFILRKQNIKEK